MSSFTGVAKILRFNWPWYAGAIVASIVGVGWLWWWNPPEPWLLLGVTALAVGNAWLVLSLAVSHLVYDRSSVAHGGWLAGETAESIVVLHAGHDEASVHVQHRLPTASCVAFDFFDPSRCASPSLVRARSEAATPTPAMPINHIPLADGSAKLVLVVFAAHEMREHAVRVAFFRDVARIIGKEGRLVVVEHQRDGWNLLAYGPGFLHFLSRRTWLRTFSQAGLRLERNDRLTPWVHRYALRATA